MVPSSEFIYCLLSVTLYTTVYREKCTIVTQNSETFWQSPGHMGCSSWERESHTFMQFSVILPAHEIYHSLIIGHLSIYLKAGAHDSMNHGFLIIASLEAIVIL